MTITRALSAIGWCTAACALVGVAAGAGIGAFCPDYYAAMVPTRGGQQLNPVHLGVGFGLNAGVFTGITVGLIVVVLVTLSDLRVRIATILAGGQLPPPAGDSSGADGVEE